MLENNPTIPVGIFKKEMKLMGNLFEISVVSNHEEWAYKMIDLGVAEIQRIEKLLTTFGNDSETNQVNKNAGIAPVKVSRETLELIKRSITISEITQGAFDITYGSIDKRFWNFDTTMKTLPDATAAKKMVRFINYKNILVDDENCSVYLARAGMRIGFGGIGKGYAAEMAKKIMKENGVESGVVNASGDLAVWGNQPNGNPWTIGVANPNHAHQIFSYLALTNVAVATSGNYEKFVMIGGKKYSHTINPKTGMPVQGIKSVTIIAPNAEIADAMATPVTIMGVEAGLHMINQIKNIEAIVIDDYNKIFTSKGIHLRK